MYDISIYTIYDLLKVPTAFNNFFFQLIGRLAFQFCFSLTNVVLTSGLTVIGVQMFSLDNTLPSVIIPSTITSIGNINQYYSVDILHMYIITSYHLFVIFYLHFLINR